VKNPGLFRSTPQGRPDGGLLRAAKVLVKAPVIPRRYRQALLVSARNPPYSALPSCKFTNSRYRGGAGGMDLYRYRLLMLSGAALVAAGAGLAMAGPNGGTVVGGSATIQGPAPAR
jgi:hypothetical protein